MEVEVARKERRNLPTFLKETGTIGLVKKAFSSSEMEAEFKSVRGGVHIFIRGSDEYRRTLRTIKNCEVRAHWHMLPEEKPLKTVVKRIPIGVEEEQVKEELARIGFKVDSVVRLKKDSENPYDVVAVTSEKFELEKKLFKMNNIEGF